MLRRVLAILALAISVNARTTHHPILVQKTERYVEASCFPYGVELINQCGLEIIMQEEGFRAKRYKDSAGVLTVGYGHTANRTPESVPAVVTREQAESLLRLDVTGAEDSIMRLVDTPLTDNQFSALVSFVFNVGSGAFARSTMRKRINEYEYDLAAAEFRKWRKSGGRVLNGLLTRRGREEQLFRMPSYSEALTV